MDQNINNSKISYLEFSFWEYYFGHIKILYLSRRASEYPQSFFLMPSFLAKSLKAKKNWQKISHILQYSFAQKTSLILRTSTHLTLKMISSRNTTKNHSDFTNFQQTCFCLVSEKIFVLHHFLKPKNCILEALWKQVSVYFFISP